MSLTPREIPTGAVRYNTDSNKMEVYIGSTWMQVAVSSPNLDGGARGIIAGGGSYPAETVTIQFLTIPTQGNSTDFGDLLNGNGRGAGCSDHTRGITFMGTNPSNNNTIEVITIQTTGNSKDFGDRSFSSHGIGALSNGHGGLS